ncbi:retrovirus-related pol polyprotein from transposon TNT 1-94 [Tanacetum coccineum]
MVPKAVLMRSSLVSLTTARPVNTTQPITTVNSARPMTNVFNKAHSTVRRPINSKTKTKNSNFNQRVNTLKDINVNAARPKAVVNTAKPKAVLNAVKGNQGNPQMDLHEKGVIDSGCSRHMTWNMSYLADFEEIDGGYVAFGGTPKEGKSQDEISGILKSFITGVENLIDQRVKVIRCDNGTEFKNKEMNQFCERKGTKACNDANKVRMETVHGKDCILLPICTNNINTASDGNSTNNVNVVSSIVNAAGIEVNVVDLKTSIELPNDPNMPKLEDIVYSDDAEDVSVEADMNNLNTFMPASPIPTTRIHKDHPVEQIIGDLNSAPQTRRMTKNLKEHGLFSSVQNKKDERGTVINNKARLVAQGYIQEERINYDEVFVPVARIEAIRLFLAYASFKDFVVYQMDVKSAFLYGKIEEKVYFYQPPGFEDPDFLDRRGKIDKTLFIRRDKGDILLAQVFTDVKTARTPMETQKPLIKDEDGEEVDVHLYISMIGLLMYLTSSRPDIMFAVYACARYQVNPKVSHLHAVKRIFRYLKGQPKLGLWYPKDSPFDLVTYTDSDYAGASLDRKSTIGDLLTKAFDLQALVDGKKIIITEATVRRDLQLEDANGVDCLPNAIIFEQLTLMGAKTTAWNEFSSTMASAIICLATNQKFKLFQNRGRIRHANCPHHKHRHDSTIKHHQPQRKLEALGKLKRKDTEIPQSSVPVENVADEAVYEERDDSLERATTTATSLDARQDKSGGPRCQDTMGDTIAQTRSENVSKFSNDPLLTGVNTPRSGEDSMATKELLDLFCTNWQQRGAWPENTKPKEKDTEIPQSSVPSDPTNIADEAVNEEPSMQLKELMDFCTKLQQRVLDLENIKTAQAQEITSLKKRVKKLEKKGGSRTHKLKRLYEVGRYARVVSSEETSLGDQEDASKQGRKIHNIDADEDITLENVHDAEMFDVNDLDGDEVVAESKVTDKASEKRNVVKEAVVVTHVVTIPVSAATITNVELTLAQTLAELKSTRPKTKGVVMQEPSKSTPTISLQLPSQVKGQGSKDKALRLQEKFDEEYRLAREKGQQVEEANIACDDIQAKIDADYQLAKRLQAQEQ